MVIFESASANIFGNSKLYQAQVDAYNAVTTYYEQFPEFEKREVLVVMPTGSGKTGLMSILPFANCKGKVLLITPGKVVRRTVFEEFDTMFNPQKSFLYKHNVILKAGDLPKTLLYQGFKKDSEQEKAIALSKLNEADIVITNIHRINSSSEEVNLMNLVGQDFFDMIIIDEAHHVAAPMWQESLNYFKASKVIKLTATPFRADKLEITNNPLDPIYEYTLGEAIKDGLLKDVIKEVEIPGELEFIHNETGQRLTLEEAKQKLNNDWINKSVALSEVCSKQIIEQTKQVLLDKRKSYPNHRVLAITCNDEHAQSICKWFNDAGLSATYVSTNSNNERENEIRLSDFAQGKYDVMVSIQMLGEGYNNPDISIISIFRPFKSLTPYAQGIGRGLRKIPNANSELDNFCNVIYHKELGLEKLWEYYKQQKTFSEVIKSQRENISEQLNLLEELGFVESRPSKKKSKPQVEEDVLVIVPQQLGSVTKYSSKGIGNEDSFSPDGFDRYLAAKKATNDAVANQLKVEIDRINQMKEAGLVSEVEAQALRELKENQANESLKSNASEGADYLKAQSLRKEYITWLNLKIEEFFVQSKLEKKGTELPVRYDFQLDSDIDNIGWLMKNTHQSVYQVLKKNIGEFTTNDYGAAKEIVVEKMNFYLKDFDL
ncbi:DEAD/DEAH box helicase family protein [Lysinibacillus sp. KU-BSD001]|uniref:DEAD/DEAH box helicase n=1 Tax=Lysinibacillus sp. KU-BSD001 TaxID=3141328 RepID=UPI0036EA764C